MILFLDIDGVLTSKRVFTALDNKIWETFDPVAVALIKKLCIEFDCKIVISSTWRHVAKDLLYTKLEESGLKEFLHDKSETPVLFSSFRGKELEIWLEVNKEDYWIALDDVDDFYKDQLPNVVLTDGDEGFLYKDYLICQEKLNALKKKKKKKKS